MYSTTFSLKVLLMLLVAWYILRTHRDQTNMSNGHLHEKTAENYIAVTSKIAPRSLSTRSARLQEVPATELLPEKNSGVLDRWPLMPEVVPWERWSHMDRHGVSRGCKTKNNKLCKYCHLYILVPSFPTISLEDKSVFHFPPTYILHGNGISP